MSSSKCLKLSYYEFIDLFFNVFCGALAREIFSPAASNWRLTFFWLSNLTQWSSSSLLLEHKEAVDGQLSSIRPLSLISTYTLMLRKKLLTIKMLVSFKCASFVRYRSQLAIDYKISDISFQTNKIRDREWPASRNFSGSRKDFSSRKKKSVLVVLFRRKRNKISTKHTIIWRCNFWCVRTSNC